MPFIDLDALPAFVPIPQFDGHVIRGGEHKRLSRMDNDGADVVGMSFEGRDLFRGIVIVNSYLEVI